MVSDTLTNVSPRCGSKARFQCLLSKCNSACKAGMISSYASAAELESIEQEQFISAVCVNERKYCTTASY